MEKVQKLNFIAECTASELENVQMDLLSKGTIQNKLSKILFSESQGQIIVVGRKLLYQTEFKEMRIPFRPISGIMEQKVTNFSTFKIVASFEKKTSCLVPDHRDRVEAKTKQEQSISVALTNSGQEDDKSSKSCVPSLESMFAEHRRIQAANAFENSEKKAITESLIKLYREFSGEAIPEVINAEACRIMAESLIKKLKELEQLQESFVFELQGKIAELQSKNRKLENANADLKKFIDKQDNAAKQQRKVKAQRTSEHGWGMAASDWARRTR